MAGGKGTDKSRRLESRAYLTTVQARLVVRLVEKRAPTTVENRRSRTRRRRVFRCVSSRSRDRQRGGSGLGPDGRVAKHIPAHSSHTPRLPRCSLQTRRPVLRT